MQGIVAEMDRIIARNEELLANFGVGRHCTEQDA